MKKKKKIYMNNCMKIKWRGERTDAIYAIIDVITMEYSQLCVSQR